MDKAQLDMAKLFSDETGIGPRVNIRHARQGTFQAYSTFGLVYGRLLGEDRLGIIVFAKLLKTEPAGSSLIELPDTWRGLPVMLVKRRGFVSGKRYMSRSS